LSQTLPLPNPFQNPLKTISSVYKTTIPASITLENVEVPNASDELDEFIDVLKKGILQSLDLDDNAEVKVTKIGGKKKRATGEGRRDGKDEARGRKRKRLSIDKKDNRR